MASAVGLLAKRVFSRSSNQALSAVTTLLGSQGCEAVAIRGEDVAPGPASSFKRPAADFASEQNQRRYQQGSAWRVQNTLYPGTHWYKRTPSLPGMRCAEADMSKLLH